MNKHIDEYLDYYISLEKPPTYAILLRGNWGSGKSWFIKKFIDEREKSSFIYVSLYGVTSYSEIEDAFFQQLHPVLASKGMKLAGKLLKGLIKTTIKVDFDNDGKEDGQINSTIPDINIPNFLKNIDSKILIFDDLERCSIDISNIMGYINQFVENNGLKVIILANEEEIIKNDLKNNNIDNSKSYLSIKEKLVGKSFDISTDFDAAIDDFINQVPESSGKSYIYGKTNLLKELFFIAGYNNLRHLRQSIFDFVRFFEILPEKAQIKNQLMEHVLNLFFSISFEIKKGNITENDLQFIIYPRYQKNTKTEEKSKPQLIREKYPIFSFYNHPIEIDLWINIFKFGTVRKELLETSILSSNYFKEETRADWIKLWYHYDLNDTEFEEIFKKVYDRVEKNEIENKYELLQTICLLFVLADKKLIKYSIKKIELLSNTAIKNAKAKGILIKNKHEEFPGSSSHGLQYSGLNFASNQLFIKKITAEIENNYEKNLPPLAMELLNLLSESIEKFGDKIVLENNRDNIYYDIPILQFIPVKTFLDTILKLSNTKKKDLCYILEKRYKENLKENLKEEVQWLEELKNLLIIEARKLKGKISGEIIKNSLIPTIEKSIKILNQ
ncbi:putative KAP P-loop domain-containing protein [Flavobacterium psychrophilum]|uniref:P-loop NTPase fold protein n=1 Tax=Flavobacterium psychrophilum TaxID=96345 RepID=UPI000B7C491E|nr:P-loop NTPase fold protein [Flavobacterium psychrophilum]SNB03496.1 putative KAP P-loop domain-containing protein [Flavobacterium psychrophilum]